jgi:poly-beta-hydroxyalkanoate depolymerase
VFEELVRLGGERVLPHVLELWAPPLGTDEMARVLQAEPEADGAKLRKLEQRFKDWHRHTVDLPGTFFISVISSLFKQNQIANNRFAALGRTIDLKEVRSPRFLLAARDNEIVGSSQLLGSHAPRR